MLLDNASRPSAVASEGVDKVARVLLNDGQSRCELIRPRHRSQARGLLLQRIQLHPMLVELHADNLEVAHAAREQGDEPLDGGVWPKDARIPRVGSGGSLLTGVVHAKCAVADEDSLLVSSANITEGALWLNLELGVLVHGGELPGSVRRHFDGLIEQGTLREVDP